LYASPNIIRVIKLRRMRWAWHVARMKQMRNAYSARKTKRRDHSEDVGIYERIILEWILGEQSGKAWTGFIWLRIGTSGELL